MSRPICFASDYGYADDFAGVCRGVIARVAPDVRVIDVTHGLPERDVLAGALVLRNTLPYMPDRAVHLTVVDPGVGGPRRAVALRSGGDRLFVGPDNGLLMLAAERDGGVEAAHMLANEELWLAPLSATFHGRDIFAPVAARLADGLVLDVAGPALDPASLVRLELPALRRHRDGVTTTALLIDRFGNVTLNLRARQLDDARFGDTVELLCGGSGSSRGWLGRSPPCARATSSSWSTATAKSPSPSMRAPRTRSSAWSRVTRCACAVLPSGCRASTSFADRSRRRLASPRTIGYSPLSRVHAGRAFCHRHE